MKHFLNIKPTVVFRKGSSFLLRTSLAILFGVPFVIALFWGYKYYAANSVLSIYESNLENLKKKTTKFEEKTRKDLIDKEDLNLLAERYLGYRAISSAYQTSWSKLFQKFEELSPEGMKITRIRIKPDKVVKIMIQGKVVDLHNLTTFLKSMINSDCFLNPNLKRHSRAGNGDDKSLVFDMEVDYVENGGDFF